MITKELQQLSDKLVGSHTSAHEISKQVDYIEKNYEGGGSGGVPVFTAIGTYNNSTEGWDYVLADDSPVESIIEHATAGDPMFLRAKHKYINGVEEVMGVYPLAFVNKDYPEPDHQPVVTTVEFGTTRLIQIGQGVSPDKAVTYVAYAVDSDGTVHWSNIDKSLT